MHQTNKDHVIEFSSIKVISKDDKPTRYIDFDFDLELNNIKSADPYANDPYDRIIQVKYIFESVSVALIRIGVFSQRELNVIVTKQKIEEIILEQKISTALPDLGIYNTFYFTKKCALEISRNIKKLIEVFQPNIIKCKSIKPLQDNIIFLDYHFYALRYIYVNLGKLHALYFHFSNQEQLKNKVQQTNDSTTEYIFDVKIILLQLLREQAKLQKTKFKTIPSATKGIRYEFIKKYDDMQQNKRYVKYQKFFDIKNLDRNIRMWRNSDSNFKRDLAEFIS